eukprot:TRINITY_DN17551_c0_g1_i1.p1 TRINITY_DN17551_c0_g1~~TRINITY_DN17551_c0_g1_i1.p1  ORF type:complete len:241 (-),score=45.27 TRINITY_DN17551_c0_g1_i1:16-714(-)
MDGKYRLDVVNMHQLNTQNNNMRQVRYCGKPRFRVMYRGPCGYGLPALSELPFTLAVCTNPPPDGRCYFMELTNDELVTILLQLMDTCTCACHHSEIYTADAVHALCTLSLVCLRFQRPIPDFDGRSIPEEAARLLCKAYGVEALAVHNTSWRRQLLVLDPKTAVMSSARKYELHDIAFGRDRPDGTFLYPAYQREHALQQLQRIYGAIDTAYVEKYDPPPVDAGFTGDGSP